jgi:hypothetical protein
MTWMNGSSRVTKLVVSAVFAAASLALVPPAEAQVERDGRVGVTFEVSNVWQERNDVRIPPDTGTEFSIVDLIGSASTPSVRTEVRVGLTERQELRFVHAPLRVTGTGTPGAPIAFAGELFAPFPTEAEYQFSSYRATWRYRFHQGPTWTWRVGFTGFVRDARIALSQPGRAAEDTDVGFVPLAHISGDARISERWHVSLELDGSAAPQGRAFDGAATINYRPTRRWTIGAGYRTIEGGADVDAVYTFAWINAVIVRAGVGF